MNTQFIERETMNCSALFAGILASIIKEHTEAKGKPPQYIMISRDIMQRHITSKQQFSSCWFRGIMLLVVRKPKNFIRAIEQEEEKLTKP